MNNVVDTEPGSDARFLVDLYDQIHGTLNCKENTLAEYMGQNTGAAFTQDSRWLHVTHWKSKDGETHPINKMETDHLQHLLNYMVNHADSLATRFCKQKNWQDISLTKTANFGCVLWLTHQPIFQRLAVEAKQRGFLRNPKGKIKAKILTDETKDIIKNVLGAFFSLHAGAEQLKHYTGEDTIKTRHNRALELTE